MVLDKYSIQYGNILLMGDFNSEPDEPHVIDFCFTYNLRNLVKDFTCFKNIDKPSCIDLMITI